MSETILWVLIALNVAGIVMNVAGIVMNIRSNHKLNASERIYEELADECDAQLAQLREANDRAEATLHQATLFCDPWPDLPDWHDEDIKPSDDR